MRWDQCNVFIVCDCAHLYLLKIWHLDNLGSALKIYRYVLFKIYISNSFVALNLESGSLKIYILSIFSKQSSGHVEDNILRAITGKTSSKLRGRQKITTTSI